MELLKNNNYRGKCFMNGSLFKFILSSVLLAFICTILYGGIRTTEKVIAVQASVSDDEPSSLGSMKVITVLSASATSVLHGNDSEYNNAPEMTVDGDVITSWQEGVEGQGSGESITLNFEKSEVKVIACYLGNWMDDWYYYANCRPKTMTIQIGNQSFDVEFTDAQIPHYIILSDKVEAESLTFTINEIYPGDEYDDCCISELTVYAG